MVWLLDAISSNREAVSLKWLSAETGLHPSTAFRLLNSMVDHGFVTRESTGNYGLGIKLLQLGRNVRTRIDLRNEAKPILHSLRDQINESVNLTVREGNEVVYVERAISTRMMRVEQVIGSRAPLHVTAVGKMMLGAEGDDACRRYAEQTGLPSYTDTTITNVEDLIRDANESYHRGYALDDEEAESGVGCIGVLIYDRGGKVTAGLSISAPIDRRKDEWIPLLMDTGQKLSAKLGYHVSNAVSNVK